jgi:hypothetical protein
LNTVLFWRGKQPIKKKHNQPNKKKLNQVESTWQEKTLSKKQGA